jgi:hypothetical protein
MTTTQRRSREMCEASHLVTILRTAVAASPVPYFRDPRPLNRISDSSFEPAVYANTRTAHWYSDYLGQCCYIYSNTEVAGEFKANTRLLDKIQNLFIPATIMMIIYALRSYE